ncbi:hypothetical protein AAFF_G00286430 [Aldrovandia affinis]|uniref:Aminopeptidase N-like N-terminal domain-containing protein n=1 Tax=Aldrovandia affinis TaxID=143900 RepID=A0AAD7X191_9TELE|nr:hypothetical protein AAFF_G00286430 [Aldrovandia affinis]
MSKGIFLSKALAVTTVVLTVASVGSIVAMITIFQIQISEVPPVPPPTELKTSPAPTGPPPNMRLSKDLVPREYTVFLQPYLYLEVNNVTNQTFFFTGNSTVKFKCMKATNRIYIHSKEMNVTFMKLTDVSGTVHRIKAFNWLEDESNFLEIEIDKHLKAEGTYYLHTKFEGEMLDDLSGIYVSQYEENVDEKR